MKRSLGIITLLFGAAFAQPIFAASIYTIDFTTTSGSPAPSGSFTYDASAPSGSQFSNFVVDWYGYSIDLTSSANAPNVSGGCGTSSSAATFAFLGGSVPCSPNSFGPAWTSEAVNPAPGGFANFIFYDEGPEPPPFPPAPSPEFSIGAEAGPGLGGGVTAEASGTWTITDTSTPEPSSLMLVSTGLLAVAFLIRKRSTHSLQVRPIK